MDSQVPVDPHLELHYRCNLISKLLHLSYLLSYTSISHRFNGAVIPGSLLTVTRRPNLEENTFATSEVTDMSSVTLNSELLGELQTNAKTRLKRKTLRVLGTQFVVAIRLESKSRIQGNIFCDLALKSFWFLGDFGKSS